MAAAAKVYVAEKGETPAAARSWRSAARVPSMRRDLARRIGAQVVVIPPRAGVASAFGMLIAPQYSYDIVRTHRVRLVRRDFAADRPIFEQWRTEAREGLPRASTWTPSGSNARRPALLGQGYDLTVRLDARRALEASRLRTCSTRPTALYGRVFDDLDSSS